MISSNKGLWVCPTDPESNRFSWVHVIIISYRVITVASSLSPCLPSCCSPVCSTQNSQQDLLKCQSCFIPLLKPTMASHLSGLVLAMASKTLVWSCIFTQPLPFLLYFLHTCSLSLCRLCWPPCPCWTHTPPPDIWLAVPAGRNTLSSGTNIALSP